MKITEASIKRHIILLLLALTTSVSNLIIAEPGFETSFCIFFGSVALLTLIVLTSAYYLLKDLRISGRVRAFIERNNTGISLLLLLDFYVIGILIILTFPDALKELNIPIIMASSLVMVYLNIYYFWKKRRQKKAIADGDINEHFEGKELSRRG